MIRRIRALFKLLAFNMKIKSWQFRMLDCSTILHSFKICKNLHSPPHKFTTYCRFYHLCSTIFFFIQVHQDVDNKALKSSTKLQLARILIKLKNYGSIPRVLSFFVSHMDLTLFPYTLFPFIFIPSSPVRGLSELVSLSCISH